MLEPTARAHDPGNVPRFPFQIADFRVDPSRNSVLGKGGEQSLEPRIMDVLCFLAGKQGEVLSRPAIIDAVWGHSFGADESLTRAVSQLRKVFDSAPGADSIIETVPKRGYRLVAAVERLPNSAAVEARPATETGARSRRVGMLAAVVAALVIAVVAWTVWHRPSNNPPAMAAREAIVVRVPDFASTGGDARGAGAEIGNGLAASLARNSLISVRREDGHPGETAASYRYAVQGSSRVIASTLRISVSLVDLATHDTLWSESYDRAIEDRPASLDSLTGSIAAQLTNHVLNAAKSTIRRKNPETLLPWELTLLATWVPGSDEVFLKAHTADSDWPQRRAIALDPDYAPAHASLASALAYRALFTSDADRAGLRSAAESHAEKALALGPYDPGVLYELATYRRLIGDRTAMLAALDRVLAIQPDHPVARFDRDFAAGLCTDQSGASLGKLEAGLAQLAADNPVRWVVLAHLADLHLARGEMAEAADGAAASRQIVRMTWSGITLAAAEAAIGKPADALRTSGETRLEWPKLDWARFAKDGVPVWCLGGDSQAARAAYARLATIAP